MAYQDLVLAHASLKAFWKLDEASGSVLDSKGTNHGTVVGGVTRGATGAGGASAYDFDGSTGYIDVPDVAALDLGNGDHTLEAWVRRDTTNTTDTIFNKGTGAYNLLIYTDGFVYTQKDNLAPITRSTATITDANPHHIVMTRSGTAWTMYIDGVAGTYTVTPQTLVDTTEVLRIGQTRGAPPTLAEWFDGRLWRLAIYNAALTAGDVTAHYNAGIASPATSLALGGGDVTDTKRRLSIATY